MARTVRFHTSGGPEVMRIESLEVGEPGPGELRVRIEAIGLNRADALFRAGQYLESPQLPARLGNEAAGIVEAVAEGVSGFAVGEAVCVFPAFSMNCYGVYAERAIVPASAVLKRPLGLSAVQASAIWMAYLTAYGALIDVAGIGHGDTVVITAASSSVGLAAIQLANSVGAMPIAVTRTEKKAAALRSHGAAHVIVADRQEVAAEILRLTGQRGAQLAFDPIAGAITAQLAAGLAPRGKMILYGNLSGQALDTLLPFVPTVSKGLSLRGFVLNELTGDRPRFDAALSFIEQGLASGQLSPAIAKTFTLDRIVEAHRYLELNQQVGKIVVTVS